MTMMPHGRASTFFADQIATYWNKPGAARDVDDQHHAEQQAERVPVDGAHRLFLVHHARQMTGARAQQRHDGAIELVHMMTR
jgi:hypothetical protein